MASTADPRLERQDHMDAATDTPDSVANALESFSVSPQSQPSQSVAPESSSFHFPHSPQSVAPESPSFDSPHSAVPEFQSPQSPQSVAPESQSPQPSPSAVSESQSVSQESAPPVAVTPIVTRITRAAGRAARDSGGARMMAPPSPEPETSQNDDPMALDTSLYTPASSPASTPCCPRGTLEHFQPLGDMSGPRDLYDRQTEALSHEGPHEDPVNASFTLAFESAKAEDTIISDDSGTYRLITDDRGRTYKVGLGERRKVADQHI